MALNYSFAYGNDGALTILYTSDLAARYQPVEQGDDYMAGWGHLAGVIQSIRSDGTNVLLLDPGDYLDEKQILCQEEDAIRVIEILNAMQYDVMGIGMDELNWGTRGMFKRLRHARFPVVSTNLAPAGTGDPPAFPYWVVHRADLRIGILGVLSPATKNELVGMHLQDLTILPPAEAITRHAEKLSRIVDLLIVLSYMDDEANRQLAREVPMIDVIIGGFGHKTPQSPTTEGGTLITHAGSGANQLGRLDLRFSQGRIRQWEHQMLTIDSDKEPDPRITALVSEAAIAEQILRAEVLGQITEPLLRQESGESNIGNWMADAMRAAAGTDIAFQNSSGIRKDLPEGFITQGDLFDLNYYNTILRFELSGSQIRSLLELNCTERKDFLQVSGLTYVYDPKREPGSRLMKVTVKGQPLEDSVIYSVATNHFVGALAERYFGFPLPPYEDTFITLYESQMQVLRKDSNVTADLEGRIQAVQSRASR